MKSFQKKEINIDDAKKGELIGKLLHIETKRPVSNATIIFRGVDFESKTDDRGFFTAELPQGEYSISVIHSEFSTQKVDSISINVSEITEVTIELTPSAVELEMIPVYATTDVRIQGGISSLLDETRQSGLVLNYNRKRRNIQNGRLRRGRGLKKSYRDLYCGWTFCLHPGYGRTLCEHLYE